MYDLTIKDNHNFALDAGVFVHNSKDIVDALAGATFTASKYAEEYAYDYGEDYDTLLNANETQQQRDEERKKQMLIDFEKELRELDPINQRNHTSQSQQSNQPFIMDDILIW